MIPLWLQVDATPGLCQGQAGVGVIVRRDHGAILSWHMARVSATTCNEAEYQAVITGLRYVLAHYPPSPLLCLTDSQLIVDHMAGRCQVRTAALHPLHADACALVARCTSVRFLHIPRALNRLVDALAWESLTGRAALRAQVQRQVA